MGSFIVPTAGSAVRIEMNPCVARSQENDIYSGLGDHSSTALDTQGVREEPESQKARCEAEELVVSEDGTAGLSKRGRPEPKECPGDRYHLKGGLQQNLF